MRSSAAGLPIVKVYVSGAMIDRLAQLPVQVERELGRKVECAGVIREAVTAWLYPTAALSLRELSGTIQAAMRRKRLSPRRRLLHRWTKQTERRLLDLVYDVSPWLLCPVPPRRSPAWRSRSAWTPPEGRPPDVLAQEIGPRP